MLKTILLLSSSFVFGATVPLLPPASKAQAKRLKEYIVSEKKNFVQRESQKKDLTDALDKLNAEQNSVRVKISSLTMGQQELNMAVDNLSMEYEKQKDLEKMQRQRLYMLLKVTYRIKRDGVIRFLFNGQDMGQLASRVRVLYRTLKSHSLITKQLQERSVRIRESEVKMTKAKHDLNSLLSELHDQEDILTTLLSRKKQMLLGINQKQSAFLQANKQYKKLEKEIEKTFSQLPSAKPAEKEYTPQLTTNLPLPAQGRIIKGFGKSVHEKFGTVTYHKGIEIEAEHNSPVISILPGTVEHAGWVKGLGNVIIVHHGNGIYTLSAYLFKIEKTLGSHVDAGETIGTVGDTGNNDRPSLYFELRENGKAVDPVAYLSRSIQNG